MCRASVIHVAAFELVMRSQGCQKPIHKQPLRLNLTTTQTHHKYAPFLIENLAMTPYCDEWYACVSVHV